MFTEANALTRSYWFKPLGRFCEEPQQSIQRLRSRLHECASSVLPVSLLSVYSRNV